MNRIDDFNISSSEAAFKKFVVSLQDTEAEPALLRKFCGSVEQEICCNDCRENHVPNHILFNKNAIFSLLFEKDLEQADVEVVAEVAKNIKIQLSQEDICEIERLTRNQSRCDLWRWVRIGRITASIIDEVIRTSSVSVPKKMSLLKKICHPRAEQLNCEAIMYGRINEPVAKRAIQELFKLHSNVTYTECGVFVDQDRPFLAASPDLIMSCTCCGTATVEIKCPFRLSGKTSFNKQFRFEDLEYLARDGDSFILKRSHKYYMQVLAQIHVTNAAFGLFFVWTKEGNVCIKIDRNEEDWNQACFKAEEYFRNIVLLELIANHYTKPSWWS